MEQEYKSSANYLKERSFKLIWIVSLFITCMLPFIIVSKLSVSPQKFSLVKQNVVKPFQALQLLSAWSGEQNQEKIIASSKHATPEASAYTQAILKANGWVVVQTKPKDTLSSVFKRVGLGMGTLLKILDHNRYQRLLTNIRPNNTIEFEMNNKQLQKMVLQIKGNKALAISFDGKHYASRLIEKKFNTITENKPPESAPIAQKSTPKPIVKDIIEYRENYLTATVQYSLYSTAKRHQIPYKLIQQMIDIFHWEVDFSKDVRGGDRFSIIYKAKYVNGKLENTGEISAVTYTNRGITHKALRHVSSSGAADYYTPEGKSLRQAFSRYPIKFSRINSPFSLSRMHPILHYNRPHKGIDLAAPIGTPIRATGDGKVATLGYESGYGNVIKIVHHNKLYTSVYAHLLRFQKGIFRGGNVKRGQVIGYVGKSGLASGPHCHYEFHVNHRPKNPKTVALPHALPVPSRDMAAFKKHADRVIEHLKLFEEAHGTGKKYHAVG